MPTASQAMIVMTGEGEDPRIPRRRYGGACELSVASYDMDMAMRLKNIGYLNQGISGTGISDQNYANMATVLKRLSTNQGTYDPVRRVYRWEVSNAYPERRPQNRSSDSNCIENMVCGPERERAKLDRARKEFNLPKLSGRSGSHTSTPNALVEDAGLGKRKATRSRSLVPPSNHGNEIALPATARSSRGVRSKFVLTSDGRRKVSVESVHEQQQQAGDNAKNPPTEAEVHPKRLSLLEDIKKTVKYDSRVHPAMYMRRHRPPPNPFAVCLSLRENDDYTHTEVKDVLESQIGLKVRSVQYDPLSIRSSDPDVGTRWIVTYATPAECEFAASKGLEVNGDKIAIKLLDDVINCECEAYILHKEEERQRRIAEETHMIYKERKRQKKQKFVCSSTQT